MITTNHWKSLLLAGFVALLFQQVSAQTIDEKTYQHKMQLLDSLSIYKMQDFDTLYHVLISRKISGNPYKDDRYGWINKKLKEEILFVDINGKEFEIARKEITDLTALPLNQTTVDTLIVRERADEEFYKLNFANNYPLVLWLYKKGQVSYSKQLLTEDEKGLCDSCLRDDFGILYYDALLSAYTKQRDYPKAIALGNHLSGNSFKGYEYQKTISALTLQLKADSQDFKTFRLPDSVEWAAMKQKFSRQDQIIYLADRLRLLNCIQPGQPSGIGYAMYQHSISYADASKLGIVYWKYNPNYDRVNPYSELLKMKLSLVEVKLLLPYLIPDIYIPSYNYHRDFFSERNLHRLNWVIESLIFEITSQFFLDRPNFDELTPDDKKAEVEKIKKWCDENAGLSQETLTLNVLKTTDDWDDFRKALAKARQAKYDSLLPVIVRRFYDFKNFYTPVHRWAIAETMFDLGNEKYITTVKKWSRDTTDIEVNRWCSLFLLKYDTTSYRPAMRMLESVLKKCDGVAYYPHAMDLLLGMNDKKAFKLAEHILDKPGFQSMMYWDYYQSFIKRLLAAKSDYTFNFFNSALESYTPAEMEHSHQDNDHVMAQKDGYVQVVDQLKNGTSQYMALKTNSARLEYIQSLNKWFNIQYALLKQGNPNELRLEIKEEREPVSFVDTYRQ